MQRGRFNAWLGFRPAPKGAARSKAREAGGSDVTFLLETNVVSELRKAKSGQAHPSVTAWASRVPAGSHYVSAVTLLELEMGVLQVERRDAGQGSIMHTAERARQSGRRRRPTRCASASSARRSHRCGGPGGSGESAKRAVLHADAEHAIGQHWTSAASAGRWRMRQCGRAVVARSWRLSGRRTPARGRSPRNRIPAVRE